MIHSKENYLAEVVEEVASRPLCKRAYVKFTGCGFHGWKFDSKLTPC
ncbi:hypothetical protein THOB06_280061 [Vibrio rotiferianus]|nr:hypothetical protein THOG10_280061 [Vibrio rotiferianus]CAH1580696.1 hypothetical protein THOB06_280061 [Vibrio rotiferianus]